ncbi:Membrane-anchored ubiquitin-fold protein [Zostera marina]|uniref:Membrane-anchored ubiquitin-fold protein n=1 Tax=Zostera marina TaxID=29655 RepID=A0A0K9NMY0_ZOSMR|nr:Membrane-anchored ubiquitin-fold protein [Zostera marina]
MSEEEDVVDIKFRLGDGSDLGPFKYNSSITVAMLKERIISDWPKDKKVSPKVPNDVKLINSGKILENSQTIAQCKTPFSDLPGSGMTMHVVIQPSLIKAKSEKKVDDMPKKTTVCSCTIL